ncbi:MAG TPA: acetyl-CoA carboxylase biotin carboxyl carrier protein subunit [Daejeonella sp.]|nr:acetyl-CoA carboxylase biotin carboxyl carrier protein subunit [Daejeonella sp.]
MFKIRVNNRFDFQIDNSKQDAYAIDIQQINEHQFHLLHQNQSYRAEIVSFNKAEKTCTVKVNSNTYTLEIKDQYDELLHRLGLDNLNTVKVANLKAPMPGLVLKVLVAEGDEVKKGDNLLILEAMKMENIIKAPADVKIKSIKISDKQIVEKNEVLLVFG